jgi:hypothetical protein
MCVCKKRDLERVTEASVNSTWMSSNRAVCDQAQEVKRKSDDTAKIAKTISDYVKVLAAPVLVAAEPEVLRHNRLAGLRGRFYAVTLSLDAICEAAERRHARTVIVADDAVLDLDEIRQRAKCFVVSVRGAA